MTSKVSQLQLLQQNLQHILGQKQQLEAQLVELDLAFAELKTAEKAYKIVGKIMIASPAKDLLRDVTEKKEIITLRLNNFSKQEEKLKQSLETVQKEAMEELKTK